MRTTRVNLHTILVFIYCIIYIMFHNSIIYNICIILKNILMYMYMYVYNYVRVYKIYYYSQVVYTISGGI